jgi:tetratricopeptide (TPR) repeat protein
MNRIFLGGLALFLALPWGARGAFLDFSLPAREAALGGNGVALPEGTSSLAFNPAGLGNEIQFEASARYEDLFSGIEGDNNLSTGNLSVVLPLDSGDGLGFSLDHFGANTLQQDRLQAAFGKSFEADSPLHSLRLGISLSFLRQQFSLLAPLAGINPSNVSATAFSVGGGALYDPFSWASVGISVEDLNQPNLGVVGTDTIPSLLRYGLAVRPRVGDDRLTLTLSQEISGGVFSTEGGAEWAFLPLGVALRAGCDENTAAIGFGWKTTGLKIDYTYQFSWNQSPSINGVGLPGSHLLEVGFSWDNGSRESRVFGELLEKAKNAAKGQNWKDAFWYYQQACLLRPSDPTALQGRSESLKKYNLQRAEAYYQAGQGAEKQGYFLEAQRDYEWAMTLAPGEGRYAAAEDKIKKSMSHGALGDIRVRNLLEKSVDLLREGERTKAIKKVKEAEELYPGDVFLQYVGRAFARKAQSPEEQGDKKMQQLAVEAEIYRSKGRMDLARETWKKMLETDPGNALAQESLAESQEETASPTQLAVPQKYRIQQLLQEGLKAYAGGDSQTALADWQEVLQIDPLNVNALNNITRVKMEEGTEKK